MRHYARGRQCKNKIKTPCEGEVVGIVLVRRSRMKVSNLLLPTSVIVQIGNNTHVLIEHLKTCLCPPRPSSRHSRRPAYEALLAPRNIRRQSGPCFSFCRTLTRRHASSSAASSSRDRRPVLCGGQARLKGQLAVPLRLLKKRGSTRRTRRLGHKRNKCYGKLSRSAVLSTPG